MNVVGQPRHHPSIAALEPIEVIQPSGFSIDFLGVRSRLEFLAGMHGEVTPDVSERPVTPAYPAFDEEYFEWIDVLEAVSLADDDFVMVELGAGFGRWSMRAAAALKRIKPRSRFHCVAVEAEPQHFRWLCQHCHDNGIDPADLDLTWGAVGSTPGFVPFRVGESGAWYGQAIDRSETRPPFPEVGIRRRLKVRSALGRPPALDSAQRSVMWVPCVTLSELIGPYSRIDLLDLDVQRQEFDVLNSAIDLLDERVRRIHVGTHTANIEMQLRLLFRDRGWTSVNDYPRKSRARTPYGEIVFGDGVQTWLNPRFDTTSASAMPTAATQAVKAGQRGSLSGAEIIRQANTMVAAAKLQELIRQNRELTREVRDVRRRERQLKVQIREMTSVRASRWLEPLRRIFRTFRG